MSDHADQGAQDLVVTTVQDFCPLTVEVVAFDRELDPNLGFRNFSFRIGELTYESRLIAPLSPGFSQIRTNRARGPADLIRERVSLFSRKRLRQLKEFNRSGEGF